MENTFNIDTIGLVRSQEIHKKIAQAKTQREIIDGALENAWLADQCVRLATAIFESADEAKAIAQEILENLVVPKGERNEVYREYLELSRPANLTEEMWQVTGLNRGLHHLTEEGARKGGRNAAQKSVATRRASGQMAAQAKVWQKARADSMRGKTLEEMYGPEKAAELRDLSAQKMAETNHVRWHVGRGVVKAGCKFCDKTDLLVTSVEAQEPQNLEA